MNNIPVHLYVVIAVLLFNGIVWAVKQLKKQKAIRDAQAAQRHEQTEMLRTGRPLPVPAQPKLETLAERQERLRQLRDDANLPPPPVSSSPAPRPQAAPITRELWPGGPVVVVGPAGAPAMPAPRPMPVPQRRPQVQPVVSPAPFQKKKNRKQPSAPGPSVRTPRPDTARPAPDFETPRTERSSVGRRIGLDRSQDAAPSPATLVPQSIQDWRRAFIAAEVLRPPVSLRNAEPGQLHV